MLETSTLATQAEIGRQLGVTRNWINQLTNEPGWPDPAEPMLWRFEDVLQFLRGRARRAKPRASYCATCGGSLQ